MKKTLECEKLLKLDVHNFFPSFVLLSKNGLKFNNIHR